MDTSFAVSRSKAIVQIVRELQPPADLVMLQELTSVARDEEGGTGLSQLEVFRKGLSAQYVPLVHRDWELESNYFVAAFARKGFFTSPEKLKVEYNDFPKSRMGRGYMLIEGEVPSVGKLTFLTSHLESEVAGTEQRKSQFAEIVQIMRAKVENGKVVVFCGDTNLRESEISAAVVAKKEIQEEKERANKDKPEEKRKLSDAFIQASGTAAQKYTWDMRRNDNLKDAEWEFPPRTRYDRVFLFGPRDRYPVCTKWQLLGEQRLPCGVFASDHWGVLADIDIPVVKDSAAKTQEKQKSSPVIKTGEKAAKSDREESPPRKRTKSK